MTEPTTIPADSQWGVQWDAFVMPEGHETVQPTAPLLELPWAGELNAEQEAENAAALAKYQSDFEVWQDQVTAFNTEVAALMADESNWTSTVYAAPDRDTARYLLTMIRDGNAGNPQARNFALVYAPPVTWTVVAEDADGLEPQASDQQV
jgi:hypothetical protein